MPERPGGYTPPVDWRKFKRGGLSDDVWTAFCDLVEYCHAFRHWESEIAQITSELRMEKKPLRGVPLANARTFRNRTTRLATELVHRRLQPLAVDRGEQDSKLIAVVNAALGDQLNKETTYHLAPLKCLAFDDFDAEKELRGEIDEIVTRWSAR